MTGPAFHLSFDCPACGKQWGENARVRRDSDCPRCGVVSRYTRARAVDPWPWPTSRAPERPYPPVAPPDPAREAAEARWHYHDADDTLDLY